MNSRDDTLTVWVLVQPRFYAIGHDYTTSTVFQLPSLVSKPRSLWYSSDNWNTTWQSILITTVDELNATNKKISGVKLIELINLLTTWHLQGASVDPEMVRKQVLLVT